MRGLKTCNNENQPRSYENFQGGGCCENRSLGGALYSNLTSNNPSSGAENWKGFDKIWSPIQQHFRADRTHPHHSRSLCSLHFGQPDRACRLLLLRWAWDILPLLTNSHPAKLLSR